MKALRENVMRVQATIADACERAGRSVDDVSLVAVSKTHPPETILEAVDAGLQHFGENRVEESQLKIPSVIAQTNTPLIWHMIGHVQSRKAKEVAPLFQVVHSVDTVKLASKLAAAVAEGKMLDVLVEMNVSGEASKGDGRG
jgi:pyridoxal phosphate enzyme (YggS family)